MTIKYSGLEEIDAVAKQLIEACSDYNIWVFDGQMGAGKTTLIKSICKHMDVSDNVSSPTFSLLNVYQTDKGEELYHFDFYRLNDEEEAYDIGIEDYFYSNNYCFIEWPENIPNLIPENHTLITISKDNDKRSYQVENYL